MQMFFLQNTSEWGIKWQLLFIILILHEIGFIMKIKGAESENFNRLYPVYLFKFMAINNYFSRGFCGLENVGEK